MRTSASSVPNSASASASRELGFADAARPTEEKTADRFARIVEARARAPDRFATPMRSRGLGRSTRLASDVLEIEQADLRLGFAERCPCGMPVQRETTAATCSRVDARRMLDRALVRKRDRRGGFVHQIDRLVGQESGRRCSAPTSAAAASSASSAIVTRWCERVAARKPRRIATSARSSARRP